MRNILAALVINCGDRIALMRRLFGTWCDDSKWRRVSDVTLTRPNRDVIRDIDYEAFEKQAFELDQLAQRADATDTEDED